MNASSKPETDKATVLQIRKIGNSLGLILPKELLTQLGFDEGDKLELIRQAEGGFKVQRHNDVHAEAMVIARQVMKEYAGTLRELAK